MTPSRSKAGTGKHLESNGPDHNHLALVVLKKSDSSVTLLPIMIQSPDQNKQVGIGESLLIFVTSLAILTVVLPFLIIGFVAHKLSDAMSFLRRLFGGGGSESASSQILQKCILCGALLRPAARAPYMYCAAGHGRLDWHGDKKWFTRNDNVGQRLQAKGFKVMSAPPACAPGTRYFIET